MPNSRLYFGTIEAPPAADNLVIHLVTLTAGDIAAKTFNIRFSPVNISEVSAWVVNGSSLVPGTDFTIAGTVVDYSISSYAPALSVGDSIQLIYKKA